MFNFLENIPRELRDKIYMCVLATPTGANDIPLFPRSFLYSRVRIKRRLHNASKAIIVDGNNLYDNNTIHLSLLLTCKQTRRECKELIWLHNGLWISPHKKTELCGKLEHYVAMEQFQRIRHVVLRLELLDWEELEWAFHSLRPLATSATWGGLESVQLLAKTDRSAPVEGFTNISNLRRAGECVDGRWYCAAQIAGQQARCQRRFVVNTGWPRLSRQGIHRVRGLLVNDRAEMSGFLDGFNEMFSGDIYVDGSICFEDGKRIAKVVKWDPREAVVEIRPKMGKERGQGASMPKKNLEHTDTLEVKVLVSHEAIDSEDAHI